ncbi:MAG: MFS transporter, partial [Caldilinea sp.]|nr:MFS transporter [Caldilinea sp.]
PVLADARLAEGAAAFGIIMAAFSGGNLIGIVVAGMVRTYRGTGALTLLLVIVFGAGMIAMGFITTTWAGAAIMLFMGLGNGYLSIRLITYLQMRTPPDLLGRIMSLILFANVGLAPLSQAAAGALSKASLTGLFVGVGLAMFGVAAWLVTQPALRTIDREMGEMPAADTSAS